jgi:hypothetical protein
LLEATLALWGDRTGHETGPVGRKSSERRPRRVMEYVSVTALFSVGVGLDIAGAYLIARGVLLSPAQIRSRTKKYWGPDDYADGVARARDRVDAVAGFASLGLGFLRRHRPGRRSDDRGGREPEAGRSRSAGGGPRPLPRRRLSRRGSTRSGWRSRGTSGRCLARSGA